MIARKNGIFRENVFKEIYLKFSRLSLTDAIKSKRKKGMGSPPPKARACFDKLNIQEKRKDILLVANINKNKPTLRRRNSEISTSVPSWNIWMQISPTPINTRNMTTRAPIK